ncbi:MAG TPA: hypothetical protein VMW38_19170 [Terriglobia bacterium]|nr:hypothetical protein [Terriglobia bacterium]
MRKRYDESLKARVASEAIRPAVCFGFCNQERLHRAVVYKTPYQPYTRTAGGEPNPIRQVPRRAFPP